MASLELIQTINTNSFGFDGFNGEYGKLYLSENQKVLLVEGGRNSMGMGIDNSINVVIYTTDENKTLFDADANVQIHSFGNSYFMILSSDGTKIYEYYERKLYESKNGSWDDPTISILPSGGGSPSRAVFFQPDGNICQAFSPIGNTDCYLVFYNYVNGDWEVSFQSSTLTVENLERLSMVMTSDENYVYLLFMANLNVNARFAMYNIGEDSWSEVIDIFTFPQWTELLKIDMLTPVLYPFDTPGNYIHFVFRTAGSEENYIYQSNISDPKTNVFIGNTLRSFSPDLKSVLTLDNGTYSYIKSEDKWENSNVVISFNDTDIEEIAGIQSVIKGLHLANDPKGFVLLRTNVSPFPLYFVKYTEPEPVIIPEEEEIDVSVSPTTTPIPVTTTSPTTTIPTIPKKSSLEDWVIILIVCLVSFIIFIPTIYFHLFPQSFEKIITIFKT